LHLRPRRLHHRRPAPWDEETILYADLDLYDIARAKNKHLGEIPQDRLASVLKT
jgi:hypothetical protein